MRYIIFGLISLFLLPACKNVQAVQPDMPYANQVTTKYGDLSLNNISVYYDFDIHDKLKPVVLFVHGGGWNQYSYTEWVKNEQLLYFNNQQVQFAAIDYSLSPSPLQLNNPNRITHPAHIKDLAKAVKWICDNATQFGIDKKKIYLLGHSAGALLVSLLATNEKYLNEVGLKLKNIKGVISLDGGAYLTRDASLLFPDDNDASVNAYYKGLRDAYYNAFTTDVNVQNDACPYLHIAQNKGIPKFLLISEGEDVPYRYIPNRMMKDKLLANGIPAILHVASGYEHSLIYFCIGTANDKIGITQSITEFIH